MKQCVSCGKLKAAAEFYDGFLDRNAFRHRHSCMRCMRFAASERYWRNPEPARRRARERKARLRREAEAWS